MGCCTSARTTTRCAGRSLVARYYTRQGHLHGRCFYNGHCDPLEETERRIRETADYIDAAQRLAGGDSL